MRLNVNNYADFKAIADELTTPNIFYSVNSGNVHGVTAVDGTGNVYVVGAGSGGGPLTPLTPTGTLTADFPGAVLLSNVSVV